MPPKRLSARGGKKGAKRGHPSTIVGRMQQEPTLLATPEVVPDDDIRQALKTMQDTLPTIVSQLSTLLGGAETKGNSTHGVGGTKPSRR